MLNKLRSIRVKNPWIRVFLMNVEVFPVKETVNKSMKNPFVPEIEVSMII